MILPHIWQFSVLRRSFRLQLFRPVRAHNAAVLGSIYGKFPTTFDWSLVRLVYRTFHLLHPIRNHA